MIKKFLLASLVLSQLMISCSSDETIPETEPEVVVPEKPEPEPEKTLEEQIAELLKKPYSELTPSQQKTKLEAEANEMLAQLDKTKSSGAAEALENLVRLLSQSHIDIFNGKNDNKIEDILNISGVYGIYSWNATNKAWTKTASSTELKFVFPAKTSQTTNNAVFSAKSISSDIKVKLTDYYGNWSYDKQTGQWILMDKINDYFFLPTSSDAVLTINDVQSATFTQTAKYSNGKEVPNEAAYKMVLNDGYTLEISGTKAVPNTAKGSFTYNGKNLISFNTGSNTEVDKLLDDDKLTQYRGKANGLIQILDNFVIVADLNLAGEAADKQALYKSSTRPTPPDYSKPNSDYKAYYTALNAYELKISEGNAANFNKNVNFTLVSKKDGTKIATIVQHSKKEGDYTFKLPTWITNQWDNTGYWGYDGTGAEFSQPYLEEVYYLKFNDNTEAEMSVYFSTEFDTLLAKFNDFVASFEK